MSGSRIDENLHGLRRGDLDDVRKLEMSYSRARPDNTHFFVEYVGGRIKAFGTKVLEVDRYLIERLLDRAQFPRRPLNGNLVNRGNWAASCVKLNSFATARNVARCCNSTRCLIFIIWVDWLDHNLSLE